MCHQNAGLHGETAGITDVASYNSEWASNPGNIRNNVDVVFDSYNQGGTYSLAKGSRPNNTTGYGSCASTYCHSGGTDDTTPFTGAPPAVVLAWNDASTWERCLTGYTRRRTV
jgi:predicted CxxxxCH...CXXCH cytochrome family protein